MLEWQLRNRQFVDYDYDKPTHKSNRHEAEAKTILNSHPFTKLKFWFVSFSHTHSSQ